MEAALAHHLRARIMEERARVSEYITAGRAGSFEEYRYLAGTIHGMDVIAREIDDLMVAFQKELDRD